MAVSPIRLRSAALDSAVIYSEVGAGWCHLGDSNLSRECYEEYDTLQF